MVPLECDFKVLPCGWAEEPNLVLPEAGGVQNVGHEGGLDCLPCRNPLGADLDEARVGAGVCGCPCCRRSARDGGSCGRLQLGRSGRAFCCHGGGFLSLFSEVVEGAEDVVELRREAGHPVVESIDFDVLLLVVVVLLLVPLVLFVLLGFDEGDDFVHLAVVGDLEVADPLLDDPLVFDASFGLRTGLFLELAEDPLRVAVVVAAPAPARR